MLRLRTDSAAGKAIAVRRGVGRVRHLDIRQLTIHQLTNSNRLKLLKASGGENIADIGTKVLSESIMNYLLEKIGVMRRPEGLPAPPKG